MENQDIHVLTVEDNPKDAQTIENMLLNDTREHVIVDHAINLHDAIECVDLNTYQVILVELSLPDSDGLDTLMKLQAEVPDTPIVVLTSNENIQLGVEAVQMGAQDYLTKSEIDSRLLLRSIRYAIERNRSDIALRQSEEEYRSLIDDVFDTSMVAVLILDRDFHVVWCNESTEVYFGIERERLLGRDKRKLIDEELKCLFADPDDYSERLLRSYEEGSFTERFECQVIPEGDRNEMWLEHWSQPIRDGMYSGGRIEQYNDITDRKRFENAEKEQRQFAEAINDINFILTGSLELDEVFQHILANLERVVPHDSASIIIIEDDYYHVAHQQSNNIRDTQEYIAVQHLQTEYKSYVDEMLETHQPLIVADVQADNSFKPVAVDSKSYVGCPILLQDEVIGFINLVSDKKDFFSDEHAKRLSAFSRSCAIAIQNAHLFANSKKLATHEERQRLARDLHDSVSQTLFTCRAMSESALRRWHKDPDGAYELIRDINQLSMTALSEMRILLLELQPKSLTRIGLKHLFEQYLAPIQARRDFELSFLVDEFPVLPPDVQLALYRITQEALNNIDKHAQATRVEIKVIADGNQIHLLISDNGVGFGWNDVDSTNLGLSIMQDRAKEIGATIIIDSEPNVGTQVKVIWGRDTS